MARDKRRNRCGNTDDLFQGEAYFPLRRPAVGARPVDLSLRIKTAMSRALKECDDSAPIVAARIAEMTGRPLTEDALYTYTAASKPDHDIGIVRFVAFVRVTGAKWLWDELVSDDGLLVLEDREAKLAQLGHLRQQEQSLVEQRRRLEKELNREPVQVRNRGARGGRS
ncbi:hypothetical protein AUC70_11870 [Methyloceanibacter stevinii]|uniref:Uncharacterized protein n=1 Tax=Methyloceanibacter stevinii TaxID=1774970 RepID=A0A1E3VJ68_9HYPH|nr:hypothetical protein [Methyloceanibacter stevinii]ODR93553.1 hypothetical protein AUC70_11870 [Methyloceanibacter stevinii]